LEYIRARSSQIKFYRKIPLFCNTEDDKFVLYKPVGITLEDMRVKEGLMPSKLFISQDDKLKGIQESQERFNLDLKKNIQSKQPEKVKETIINIMQETLEEPRSGSLEGVSQTVDILVGDYIGETDIIKNLLFVAIKDYTTILHSINVMALVLSYAGFMGYSLARKKVLGLSALLHDVGKTQIDTTLLTAPRKLTEEEFIEIQQHSIQGYRILDLCQFGTEEVKNVALDHHEKLDGSGYPNGKRVISESAQLIGFIDCYESLTNDDRPYRKAMDPFNALLLIKSDVDSGKFNRDIFEKFTTALHKFK
jgi:HD-GYP domain-containing protein (c-di-GMP phosphodiesterase class II)